MNPFEYLNSINTSKENLMTGTDNDQLAEKDYAPFMVNRGLSYFQDTIAIANEMNVNHHLDHKPQYEFLLNIVRPRKRFSKWFKKEQSDDLEAIKEYYGYSTAKSLQVLPILTPDQITKIKEKLEKGGI
jgi:hypothetical protein